MRRLPTAAGVRLPLKSQGLSGDGQNADALERPASVLALLPKNGAFLNDLDRNAAAG